MTLLSISLRSESEKMYLRIDGGIAPRGHSQPKQNLLRNLFLEVLTNVQDDELNHLMRLSFHMYNIPLYLTHILYYL